MEITESTRQAEWRKIDALDLADPVKRSLWSARPVIEKISEEEWAIMHAGSCTWCGKPARLYPSGWACTDHAPGAKS